MFIYIIYEIHRQVHNRQTFDSMSNNEIMQTVEHIKNILRKT